jgi:MFS family permease
MDCRIAIAILTSHDRSPEFALALITFAITFTDVIAYSVAVPVLPDLTRTLGASATTVGLLFASFGAAALCVAIPVGAVSDRIGRKDRSPPAWSACRSRH